MRLPSKTLLLLLLLLLLALLVLLLLGLGLVYQHCPAVSSMLNGFMLKFSLGMLTTGGGSGRRFLFKLDDEQILSN